MSCVANTKFPRQLDDEAGWQRPRFWLAIAARGGKTAARDVADRQVRVKPDQFPALPQAPVQFIVLIADESAVEPSRRLQGAAAEDAQIDGIDRPFRTAQAVAGVPSPQG